LALDDLAKNLDETTRTSLGAELVRRIVGSCPQSVLIVENLTVDPERHDWATLFPTCRRFHVCGSG